MSVNATLKSSNRGGSGVVRRRLKKWAWHDVAIFREIAANF